MTFKIFHKKKFSGKIRKNGFANFISQKIFYQKFFEPQEVQKSKAIRKKSNET